MKISLYLCVHIKRVLWKFHRLNPKIFPVICPLSIVDSLKSRLIFNISYCFWMFVNKLFIYLTCAYLKSKRCFHVKLSTYYFHIKMKILADFQICISLPLILTNKYFKNCIYYTLKWFVTTFLIGNFFQ